jgi:hypothetical protein
VRSPRGGRGWCGDVAALLHRDRRDAHERLPASHLHHVADREGVGVVGNRQVGRDEEPSGAVHLRARRVGEKLRERGRGHARGPYRGAGRDHDGGPAGAVHRHRGLVEPHDRVVGHRRDAELGERAHGLRRQRRREAAEDPVGRLGENDPGTGGIDRPEVAAQRVPRDLADLAAISTPVGPAPTTTKVSQACRRPGSCSTSAASNARRIRRRASIRLSIDLSSGAASAHSSWPK